MAFIKQIKVGNNTYDIHKKVTVTIAAADWTAATIDKTVSGMTVNDIVVVSPAPSSIIGARNSVVYCSAIKANALSFTYSVAAPTTALTMLSLLNLYTIFSYKKDGSVKNPSLFLTLWL